MRTRQNIYGDWIGYVTLLDSMGDDFTPAEDARTSTDKGRLGPEKDKALQERLLNDSHTSPFEGVVVKFELCVPLFVLRELDRHRTTGKTSEDDPFELVTSEENMRKWFSRNEMSGRYIQMPDLYYHPVDVRGQSKTNKQGGGQDVSSISPEVAREFKERGLAITRQARELYSWGIEQGIEKGLARVYNVQTQYTRVRFTGSIKNWLDVLRLRLPHFVLWECRVVAEAIEDLLSEEFPEIMKSWRDKVFDCVSFTQDEISIIKDLLQDRLSLLSPGTKAFDSLKKKLE